MKSYKAQVVVTKTMWVTQDDIDEDMSDGMFSLPLWNWMSKWR